jgi:hypothetical protein
MKKATVRFKLNRQRCVAAWLVAAGIFCGCANVQNTVPATIAPTDAKKIEQRNNAASLLADLLGDEKNVSKVLLIKRHSDELGQLIKAISRTSADGAKQLETLAKSDPALNLKALQLPPGEKATRAAISQTKEHELLFNSGENFEFYLLLTQTDALSYGSHLAKIAAENSPRTDEARAFHALDLKLDDLFHQVVARMRSLPPK